MEKKCATCAHCSPCEWVCKSEESGYRFIVDDEELWCGGKAYEERDVMKAYRADGTEILTFAGVKLLEAYERIVKYEKLEQVAKHLLEELRYFKRNGYFNDEIYADYREQLIALGVDV